MTFQQWANDYCSRFSNFGSVMLQSTSMQADFKDLFDKFPVDVLQKATREIALLDPQPFPNEHIPKLLARCKAMTFMPNLHNVPPDPFKEPRYKCLRCRDDGFLRVYDPMAYQPIKDGTFDQRRQLRELVVACPCGAGDRMAAGHEYGNGRTRSGLMRFNEQIMQPVVAVRISDQVAELTDFVLHRLRRAQKFSGFEGYQ